VSKHQGYKLLPRYPGASSMDSELLSNAGSEMLANYSVDVTFGNYVAYALDSQVFCKRSRTAVIYIIFNCHILSAITSLHPALHNYSICNQFDAIFGKQGGPVHWPSQLLNLSCFDNFY
ncbi:hypothetical protein NPIL_536501, partial [Nephila pilipes]